jgi:hypothetical protein
MAINALGLNDDVVSDAFERKTKEPRVQVATATPSTASDAGGQQPAVVLSEREKKAGLESDKERLLAEEAKRKKGESEAKSAAEKARQAAIYEEYKPELTKKFQPFEAPKESFSSLAGIGMMLMAVGSMGGKKGLTSATGAMNAIAGMATGYQQGRKEEFDRQKAIFDENYKIMKDNQAQIEKEFQYALKYAKTDLTGAANYLKQQAIARGDKGFAAEVDKSGPVVAIDKQTSAVRSGLTKAENDVLELNRQIRLSDARIADEEKRKTAGSQRPYSSLDEEGKPVLRKPGTNEIVTDERGNPIRPATAAMVTAANRSGLTDDVIKGMVDQYLAGDRTVMQGFGTSLAGQRDKEQFRSALYKTAKERGITPDQLVTRMAEVEGLKAGERELARTIVRVGYFKDEANALVDQALEKSANVSRFDLVPLNKAEQKFNENVSDPNLKQFAIANNALLTAYTKVMNPTGAPTDLVRRHSYELLSTADSQEAYRAGVAQLVFEMEQAEKSPQTTKKRFETMYGGASTSAAPSISADDERALQWANEHPNDPRAAQIKRRLGVQ